MQSAPLAAVSRPAVLPFSGGRHGSAAAARQKLQELKGLLAEKFPRRERQETDLLATGLSAVDDALGGGLPQGAVTEIVTAAPSSGGQLLLQSLLAAAGRTHQYLAVVDGSDGLDPQSLEAELLPYLLWVRCHQTSQALQAADLLVRDGNLSLILLDLRGNGEMELRRQPASTWFRLQRAVEQSGAVLAVLSPCALVGSATVRLVLTRSLPLAALEEPAEAGGGKLEVEVSRNRLVAGEEEAAG
jgi:hypothetical protein